MADAPETATWTHDGVPDRYFGLEFTVGGLRYTVKRATWRSVQHPRDHEGRFIEVGARVTLVGGGHGTYQGVDPHSGRIRVLRNGRERLILRSQVQFEQERDAPKPKPKPGKPAAAKPDPAPSKPASVPSNPLPPSPIVTTPGKEPRAKADMASSQRAAVNELNIDNDITSPANARLGATYLRANKPMTADMAESLATVVRARLAAPDLPKPKKNSLAKAAEWLDTVVAQLRGFDPAKTPGPGTSSDVDVEQVKAGDVLALPGPGGAPDIRQVVEAKQWYGVYKFTLKDKNGGTETRFVGPGTPLKLFDPDGGIDGALKLLDATPGSTEPAEPKTPKAPKTEEPPKALYDAEPGADKQGPGAVPTNVPWYDTMALADETPIPVSDLTVEGYTVKSGVAFRRFGRSHLVELKPGETQEQALARVEKSVTLIKDVLGQVPPEKAALLRGFAFLEGANPADSYWAQKYNMPGFHTGATGGFGSITIWNGEDPKPTTIAHELGHVVDSTAFGTDQWLSEAYGPVVPGQKQSWKVAASSDAGTSAFYQGRFKETRLHPFVMPIKLGETGVTEYGSVDPREDFAESVRLWMKDRREGKVGFDPTTGHNLRFSDLFPERARVLDAVFGTTTDFDTPARQARRKEVEERFLKNLQEQEKEPTLKGLDDIQQMLASGLPLDEVQSARQRAMAKHAKEKADAKAAAEAEALKAKLAAEKVVAENAAAAEVASITAALAAGKLEKADAGKFRAAVTRYKTSLRKQGFTEDQIAQMAAAYETSLMHKHFGLGTAVPPKVSPKFSASENKVADGWLGKAGESVHPLAKDQGWNVSQAKANIAAELANRLNNPDDWDKMRAHMSGDGWPDAGPFESHSEETRHTMLTKEVSARVQQWAANSGDSSNKAVLMQQAAKEEFGLSGHPAPRMSPTAFDALMQDQWSYSGPWFQRVARVMYEHTQEEFKAAGITHVSVYRGMGFQPWSAPDWAKTGDHRVELQPINSWSTKRATSMKFTSAGSHKIMMKASIPVELILGSARTGFGCFNEQEFVVFDSDGDINVKVL